MKNNTQTVGFTCGAMDLLHAGHVLMLKECRSQCDKLIVALQSDPSIDRVAKNRPIQSMEERQIQLEGCRYVDEIVHYDTEADLVNLLKTIKPDVRFLGADWKDKKFTGHDLPIKVIFNSRDHGYSSSDLRKRIYKAEASKESFGAVSPVRASALKTKNL
ncbi:MAG TPA: adenylyltransferase/cytidyltransferase family protein [Candidatus Paceibacterota bacterium]